MPVLLERVVDVLRTAFWVVPALCCVTALVLGIVLPELDQYVADEVPYLFTGGPSGARSLLEAISTSMIAFTGLVFSITVVTLQLASSQFSPRVLRNFLSSRITQWSLGIFTSTFLYAVVVLRSVRGGDDDIVDFVPQLAVTGAFVLLISSVGLFLAYIQHITSSIQIATIVRNVGSEARDLIARDVYGADGHADSPADPPRAAPGPSAQRVAADRPGFVVRVDLDALRALASSGDATVTVCVQVGDFVPEGATLLVVEGPEKLHAERLRRGVPLGPVRAHEHDLAFGFRQLVDIAEKALSPGVNDPTTAVQALDELHDVLRRLAGRPDRSGTSRDTDGTVRVVAPQRGFADFLDLALDEPIQYGRDSIQVRGRILRMLDDLEAVARPEHRPAVHAKRHRLLGGGDDVPGPA